MFLRLRARAPLAAAGLFALLLLPAPARAAEPAAPLVDASARGDLTAVRALIGKKVDVNAPRIDGMTALHAAVHADRLDVVDALLRAGAKATAVDRYGKTIPPYRETRDYVRKVGSKAGDNAYATRKVRIYKTIEIRDGRVVPRYSSEKPTSGTFEIIAR